MSAPPPSGQAQAQDDAPSTDPEALERHLASLEKLLDQALPGQYYDVGIAEEHAVIFAAGMATMGFSPAAAIGAKLGAPERNVICLVGDGGLMSVLGALALFVFPRRLDATRAMAFAGALMIGFQLVLTHWMYLYLPWVMVFVAIALLAVTNSAIAATAQYPLRPVRVIAPFPPGGGVDIVARAISEKLTGRLGQSFVVDNRPGAGTTIGTELATKATPDGHTLLMANSAWFVINPNLYRKLPYDPLTDLVPVSVVTSFEFALAVAPIATQANTLSTRATMVKGSLRENSATAAPQTESNKIHSISEPSCPPHTAAN